ncbi:hypothetical protein [Nonomuraea sp. bgisy101]|uniref:hypothetical protein n=1 Tax=Nonomuraea sp. bgisy101 TaxID=3413784 RepID=UPI003D71EB68
MGQPPSGRRPRSASGRRCCPERIAADGGRNTRTSRDAKKYAAEARQHTADYQAKDAHTKAVTGTQTPAEHARRWPWEIWGPYRVFPDLASDRDWCAHCNVRIG